MWRAASEIRNSAASAMSSGLEADLERRGVDDALADALGRLLAEGVGEPARVDEAGADGVDADLGRQRAGERQRHGVERALGGGVGHRRAAAGDAGDRRGHQHARALGGLQQAAAGADHLERPHGVDREQPQEVLLRQRVEVGVVLRVLGDAGVVDQRVEPAEARGGAGDPAAVGVLRHVALRDRRPRRRRRARARPWPPPP